MKSEKLMLGRATKATGRGHLKYVFLQKRQFSSENGKWRFIQSKLDSDFCSKKIALSVDCSIS